MAEVTAMRNDALPYPIYGLPWTIVFPLLDADGDPVSPSSPDSEVSKNGDTFADCTNEMTEIATSSGVCYLTLTGTEMTADVVSLLLKSTGAKSTVAVLYPRKLVSLRAGTVAANAADGTTLQLDSGASAVDDYYNGCLLVGVLDSTTEARIISDYAGSTKVCTVSPAFNTSPDNNDTFTVYLPEGRQVNQADAIAFNAVAATSSAGRPEVNTTHAAGTAWGSGAITAASIGTGAIDADALAADAGTEIGTAVWATTTRALTILDEDSTTLDLDATIRAAIGLASANLDTQLDALPTAAENADAVWDEDATGHQTGGTFGQAIGDPGASTETLFKAIITDPAGTNIAADIIAIKAETASILTDTAEIGAAGAGLTAINLPDQTMNITGNITGNVSGSVGSVTGNVGGTINGLTATALADFFDTDSTKTYADAVAGSVVAEIADNAGGVSLTVQDIVDGVFDEAAGAHTGIIATGIPAIKAKTDNLPSDPADASVIAGRFDTLDTSIDALPTNAELATALGTADDAVLAAVATVDTVVDAIKVKTDQLTFTVANQVDANAESMNATEINGTGTSGDKWRGA